MVLKSKKSVRGQPRKRRAVRKAIRRPRRYNMPEKASLTEVLQSLEKQSNTNYGVYNVSLSSLNRAQNVAKGYQYFRIKRVKIVFKPQMDTFTAGGVTVPYLYYMIDRTQQFKGAFTLEMLKASGAKARRLDDKSVTLSWTPSVLTETYDDTPLATTAAQYKMSPWLPCKEINNIAVWNASTVDHHGICWRVETLGGNIGYSIDRIVEIEFKKPYVPPPVGQELEETILV